MKRIAVGLIVVLALTGCVPGVFAGAAESKTNRIAAELEKLPHVSSTEREFSERGLLKPTSRSWVTVSFDEGATAADLVAVFDRYLELDWRGESRSDVPQTKLSLSLAADRSDGYHVIDVTEIAETDPASIGEHVDAFLAVSGVFRTVSMSLDPDRGGRSWSVFTDEDYTPTQLLDRVRAVRGDLGDDPGSRWNITRMAQVGTGSEFVLHSLPPVAVLDAVDNAWAAAESTGGPLERFSLTWNLEGSGALTVSTRFAYDFAGRTEAEALDLVQGTPLWPASIQATSALDSAGVPFRVQFAADTVGVFAALASADCTVAFSAEHRWSVELWQAWLGDRTAADGSTAWSCAAL
jgi:hypothetical protein